VQKFEDFDEFDVEGGANCKAMQPKRFSNFAGGEGLARMLLDLLILAHAGLRKGRNVADLSCGSAKDPGR
jgi:hypothetical protein